MDSNAAFEENKEIYRKARPAEPGGMDVDAFFALAASHSPGWEQGYLDALTDFLPVLLTAARGQQIGNGYFNTDTQMRREVNEVVDHLARFLEEVKAMHALRETSVAPPKSGASCTP